FILDSILLGFIKQEESVGIYQAVFRLILFPLIIPEIFINSFMPVLAKLFKIDPLNWVKLSVILYKIFMFIGLIFGIFFFIYSDIIINIIYGYDKYSESISILKIFSFIIIVRFLSEVYGLMLTTSENQKARMYIVIVATLINIIINLFFIPNFGIIGAAITSLITNLFVYISFVLVCKLLFNVNFNIKINLKFILINLFTIGIIYYIKEFLIIPSIILIVLYILLLYRYIFDSQDKVFLYDFIKSVIK
ncbi:MAG: polysaccharide biosynthesis C-terminal domain-containing protein, partial [Melioribacter sp.]|nr:polysaccharide biosynthesis C-terminal domain-containing protein [Melioribacter sp.]